jgi:hypothetical protein
MYLEAMDGTGLDVFHPHLSGEMRCITNDAHSLGQDLEPWTLEYEPGIPTVNFQPHFYEGEIEIC